tara:strand:- start:1597 stop:2124 length:528 start_codon:yes stop_codon:yes gene_type:complete
MIKKLAQFISFSLVLIILLNSCNAFKPKYVDTRKRPVDARERAMQNIKEGKGVGINLGGGKNRTTYQFSTSNPMWRASLEVLDFLPLTTVDYSGGIIITDWYNDSSTNDAIKITVRFLSNEVQSNSLKITVHQKICDSKQNCTVSKISSKIEEELAGSILKNAATFLEAAKNQKK